jgi:hypothetical protein
VDLEEEQELEIQLECWEQYQIELRIQKKNCISVARNAEGI